MAKKSLTTRTPTTASESTGRRRAKKAPSPAADPLHQASFEEIAEAAYHRYLRRGGSDGADFDDWVEAEQELRLSRR